MDNQNIPTATNTPPSPPKRFLTRKIFFIGLGVVILAEVIWAGSMLMKPTPAPQLAITLPIVEEVVEKETVISLTTSKNPVKVGDSIDVAIDISSSKKTSGTDLIIKFDQNKLTVQNPKSPVVKGSIYTSYPVNEVSLGKITVSGITEGKGVLTDGLFGVITFKAKSVGVATISVDFTPGSTTDTNVIETESGIDVLERVQNLEVNIQ